jgi:predicted nucleic acid-binding protein
MTLIWGLRDVGQAADQEKENRALLLLKQLDAEDAEVVISAVSVAELITPLTPQRQTNFITELHKQFRVAPFDLSAAALAADLYRTHQTSTSQSESYGRKILRADTLIVASLKVAGVTVFYSHDKKCRNLASKIMVAHDLPTHDENLFP